jgi:hypothetical protein
LNATFFGWWFIQSTATVTTGTPTLAAFSEYTLGVQGGATNGLSGAALKGNNGSDFLDAAAVRTNIGLGTTDSPTFSGLDLNAIAASKAITAVDGLAYATRLDSDGGAWIDGAKARASAYYNETLNTTTRGATRAFPANAVPLAEASKVTICDGDDTSLPMWRVEDYTGLTIKSVAMLNGKLVIGTTTGVIISDYASGELGTTTLDYTTATTPAIVNNSVKDVTMTVLRNAPIDPATGIQVPTIAVATNGGVSVIKDDGLVVNGANTSPMNSVRFNPLDNTQLLVSRTTTHIYVSPEYLSSSFPMSVGYYHTTGNWLTVFPTSSANTISETGQGFGSYSSDGLALVAPDLTTPANGMVTYLTSTYNTGWMQGGIEVALSDSLTDRSVTGTTITDNGTAVIAAVATGAEQKKITATGGTITAPITTGGALYGWELISSVWYYRANTGWIGVSEAGGVLTVADGTTFSMLRYTNGTGPSANQHVKIENDEKHMFQDDALAVLSADAVTALSHDPITDMLYVGGASGMATVSGITPVSRDATAVSTFISVVDGLEIKQ